MKALLAFAFLCSCTLQGTAQQETYDIASFIPPKSWKKQTAGNNIYYSHIDNKTQSWCMIGIYKSTASSGTVDADFNSEWELLIAKEHQVTAGPQKETPTQSRGWSFLSAGGRAIFNGKDMAVVLKVASGYNTCMSFVVKTNNVNQYLKTIEAFDKSISLKQPEASTNNTPPAATGNFKFLSTNWDDQWITYARDNWAEVVKGDLKVLVHYPNKNADAYNSVLKDGLINAWNILVAPRYSNIRNMEIKPIQSFESIAFCEADATEKATGKQIHVVLFKKHYSNGNGRYLEFITNGKAAYEQEFGAYHNDEFGWDKPANMQYRNKFSVAAGDLPGKWNASDYASLTYYYVSSGGFAGATATSISHEFTFMSNGSYQSDQAGASGVVGNQKFSRQVYKGKFTVNNWNMQLTNRFQGQTEKFDCYFEAVKGGRILIMTDKTGTVYSLVKVFK